MSGINFKIEADTDRTTLWFDELPRHIKQKVKAEISRLTNQLLARVKASEPVRTGTLRQATTAVVAEGANWVRGRVQVSREGGFGARFGALEYGAPGRRRRGLIAVRPYSRQGVAVRGYQRRQPTIRERRFLRGPAAAQRAAALAALKAIVNEAVAELNK